MKSFAVATLAVIASAQVNQISIEWEPSDVQDWAIEWDLRYQPIREGWADLFDQTGSAIEWSAVQAGWQAADLLENGNAGSSYSWAELGQNVTSDAEYIWTEFASVSEDLIAQEQTLNEEMLGRAHDYLGTAIVIDGVPLNQICPSYADDWDTLTPVELFSDKNIAKTVAKAKPNQPLVAAKVTIDVNAMREWAEATGAKWEAIEEQRQAAFWEDYTQITAWFNDISNQIRDTTTMQKQPLVLTECDWDSFYQDYICRGTIEGDLKYHAKEAGIKISQSELVQWAESKAPAYEAINDAYEEAADEQWNRDVSVVTNWYTSQTQLIVSYLTNSAQIYKDLQDKRDAAYAAQWEQDAPEFREHLAQLREDLAVHVDEVKVTLAEKKEQLRQEVERRVSELYEEIEDFIEEIEEELQQDAGAQVMVKKAPTSTGYGWGFAATGLLAAAAYAYHLKKNEKKVEAQSLINNDSEFEKL